MHIAIIDKEETNATVSGISLFTQRLIASANKRHHRVTVLRFMKGQSRPPVYALDYSATIFNTLFFPIFLPSVRTLPQLRTYLTELQPDIVYQYPGISSQDYQIPAICHEFKIPVAAVLHRDISADTSFLNIAAKTMVAALFRYFQSLDLLHVFSPRFRDFCLDRGIAAEKIIVLPNGVDESVYKPGVSAFAKKHDITTGILFMGRLSGEKAPELLISSFLSLHPARDQKLVIMGDGPLYKTLVRKYPDPHLLFTGYIGKETEKLDIIRSCRIFVQPSLTEGMSLALLESMSCGLCVLSSDAGANDMAVKDAGFLIPCQELKKQLPQLLSHLLSHPDEVRHWGMKARAKILKDHCQEEINTRLFKAFADTIRRYHQPDGTV